MCKGEPSGPLDCVAHRTDSDPRWDHHAPMAPLPSRADDPLHLYKSRRDFALTPEPAAGEQPSGGIRIFVVQKHWASALHYDFRLELDGVMKSWAIPKGPSLDPKVKRMAVQVEDHPLAYASFEGVIPARQYGAGKVIVWDAGTWLPVQDPRQACRDGNLKFELRGHKLQGRWVLVRMQGKGEKQPPWLLIKERDAFARAAADYSVVDARPWSVVAPATAPHRALPVASRSGATREGGLPPGAVPAALPTLLAPQLAVLSDTPPSDHAAWLYEIKWDGYRMLVRNDTSGARLFTRNGHDWTSRLPALRSAFEALSLPPGWYDGEVVVPDADGVPDFGALQQSFDAQRTDEVVLYLFDLPHVDGHDLRSVPLDGRRAVLKRLLTAASSVQIRFSEEFAASPQSVLASACKMGLEGVIAKRRSAPYQSTRSSDWIKLKCGRRQEFVVAGYTDPKGARRGFGALVLGVHDAQGRLQYAGNVGTGFTEQSLHDIAQALVAGASLSSPFPADVKIPGNPHWVKPALVAEVAFGEWTRAGRIRHAAFRGLRTDKGASAIVRETAPDRPGGNVLAELPAAPPAAPTSRLQVTHPQRVVDASTGVTKLALARYYDLVGDLMLKHLKGRPVSLVRAPSGVGGTLFFQKHVDTARLAGITAIDLAHARGTPPMLQVMTRQGLLSAAQWNVIELHTGNASTVSLVHPDRMVFDLDPGEGVAWTQVQEAAQLLHAFLDVLGLPSFLKTSGGKGLHVVVPVRRLHDWDVVKGFSRAVVLHMARTIPQRFVARSGPKNRVGKIFIDYLRNGEGATTVSAWSARARPGLGISVPVAWEELGTLRGGDHWSVRTVHQRLDTGNGPWSGYARAARGLAAAMSRLDYPASAA
jgi:bifunctional non-homologous end joining protein LigD